MTALVTSVSDTEIVRDDTNGQILSFVAQVCLTDENSVSSMAMVHVAMCELCLQHIDPPCVYGDTESVFAIPFYPNKPRTFMKAFRKELNQLALNDKLITRIERSIRILRRKWREQTNNHPLTE